MFQIPHPFSRRGLFILARGLINLFGGILLGMGLFLWGQALFVDYVRNQVESTFFLSRWVGKISFVFMETDTKLFLSLADIPKEDIAESIRWARGLLITGGCIAMFSFFLRSPMPQSREKKRGAKYPGS